VKKLWSVAVGAVAFALLPVAAAEARPAPPDFYGVVSQASSFSESDVAKLKRGGVGTVRFVLPWQGIETAPDSFRWDRIDAKIDAIREAGAEPLPVLYGYPRWLGTDILPPVGDLPAELGWQRFLAEVVGRYGKNGTRVAEDPGFEPITEWQIWNEPNLPSFWGNGRPDASDYVTLLRLSALAINSVDPTAELIAAGLSPARDGVKPPKFLTQVYRGYDRLGIKPDFDHISLNPYARSVRESRRQVKSFSNSARRAAGRRPRLLIAEIGWASGGPKRHPATTTKKLQAKRLRSAYRMFERKRKRWRISSVHWYAWRDLPPSVDGCVFCGSAGLFNSKGRAKPAWDAYRRVARRAR
jgi:hypothetical protein